MNSTASVLAFTNICILFVLIVSIVKLYFDTRFKELLAIAGGWLLSIAYPVVIIYFKNNTDPTSRTFLLTILIISVNLLLVGLLIILRYISILTGIHYHLYYPIMFSIVFWGLGAYSLGTYIVWDGNHWDIRFWSPVALIGVALAQFMLLFELTRIAYDSLMHVSDSKRLPQILIFLGWGLITSSVLQLGFERIILDAQTYYFLLITAGGAVLIVIGLFLEPFALIPHTIGAHYILILNSAGETVFERTIGDSKLVQDDTGVFSAVIINFFNLFRAMLNETDHPPHIKYLNQSIMIASNNGTTMFILANRSNPVVENIMRQALEFIKEERDEDKIWEYLQKNLYFAF